MISRKILIVDDDADDRAIIKEAIETLTDADAVCFAENGEQALDHLQGTPDAGQSHCLIVLDLNMPKLSGTQTLQLIKNDPRLTDIPVIIYSTSINPVEAEKCMQLGAHSYISKPVSFQESIETAAIFFEFIRAAK